MTVYVLTEIHDGYFLRVCGNLDAAIRSVKEFEEQGIDAFVQMITVDGVVR